MKLKPLNGFVLLSYPHEPDLMKLGSIVIPGAVSRNRVWRIATVVAIDEDGVPNKNRNGRTKHEVNVGDKVVIDRIFGDRIYNGELHSEGLRVVSEDQITGIISTEDGSEVPSDLMLDL